MLRRLLVNCHYTCAPFLNTISHGASLSRKVFEDSIINKSGFLCTKNLCTVHLDSLVFEEVCEETLDSLADYFDEIVETIPVFKSGDVTYSDGVITASLGINFGTYVINRQTPNKQIWLSSPTSGPKRYDFINRVWVYKHDSTTLHELLEKELSDICKEKLEFTKHCTFGSKEN